MLKYYRKLVLNKHIKYYDLSTGFCSVKYWRTRIEKKLFALHEKIHHNFDFFLILKKVTLKYSFFIVFSLFASFNMKNIL